MSRAFDLARRRRVLAAVGLIVAGTIVIVLAANLAGTPGSSLAPAVPSRSDDGPVTTAAGDVPAVAPLRGCRLLSDQEVVLALGLLALPFRVRNYFATGVGEGCTWRFEDATGVRDASLRITPGEPEDFEPGSDLGRLGRRDVQGVGSAAVWFTSPSGGILSTVEVGDLGFVFVRVSVSRPDLDDGAHLDLATDLATAVLPRFPGISRRDVEPTTISFNRQPPDRSGDSLSENLLARERAGEWTRAEGLAATLRLLTGDASSDEVLRHGEIGEVEATDVLEMAREYLMTEPGGPLATEIAELLDTIVLSNEELERMAGIGQLTAALPGATNSSLPRPPTAATATSVATRWASARAWPSSRPRSAARTTGSSTRPRRCRARAGPSITTTSR